MWHDLLVISWLVLLSYWYKIYQWASITCRYEVLCTYLLCNHCLVYLLYTSQLCIHSFSKKSSSTSLLHDLPHQNGFLRFQMDLLSDSSQANHHTLYSLIYLLLNVIVSLVFYLIFLKSFFQLFQLLSLCLSFFFFQFSISTALPFLLACSL